MTIEQPEALRLAAELRAGQWAPNVLQNETALRDCAADEMDRLHAENETLHAENETLRSGLDAARLEIESLQAQFEAVGAAPWQPIATAPKDGSEILLRSNRGRIANGMWSAANERSGFWAWAYVQQEPVEWMPLPSAQALDAWLPIGEDQKDGEEILAYGKFWHPKGWSGWKPELDEGHPVAYGFGTVITAFRHGYWQTGKVCGFAPTHWMPLPATPAAIAAQQGEKT